MASLLAVALDRPTERPVQTMELSAESIISLGSIGFHNHSVGVNVTA